MGSISTISPSLRGVNVHHLPLPPRASSAHTALPSDRSNIWGGLTVSPQGKRNGFERHRLFQIVKQNLVVHSNTLPRAWGKAETQQQGELGGGNQWPRQWRVQPLSGQGNRQPVGDRVVLGWRAQQQLFFSSFIKEPYMSWILFLNQYFRLLYG